MVHLVDASKGDRILDALSGKALAASAMLGDVRIYPISFGSIAICNICASKRESHPKPLMHMVMISDFTRSIWTVPAYSRSKLRKSRVSSNFFTTES